MLKKHNKLIMLLVLVTFMFTMVGSAGAATFSDVTGNSAEASAIYRLNGLGVLDGYPDGTFGPEKTITRAEFAKIACVTAGLKSVASGMGGTASPFSDVATNHWANGWINVAAAQGYVKGDPAGTFRPEDQITQAEVVTVLLRLLGYNDNLAGEWPSDYIAKAANLGVLDDVTFMSNQAATRGVVAVLTSATLDENVVEYVASDNLFNEAQKTYSLNGAPAAKQSYTLLYDKFKEATKTEDALIMGFDVNSDGEYTIHYYTYDKDFTTQSALLTKKVADVCSFSGGSILDCIECMADFVVNDDGEVISINVKDYKKIGPKTAAGTAMNELKIDGGKVEINGTDYSFIQGNIAVEAFSEGAGNVTTINPTAIADAKYDKADAYAVIMNDDDKVVAIRAWTFPTPGIVESVSGERINYIDGAEPAKSLHPLGKVLASNNGLWNGFDSTSNFKDKDIYVQRNGKPATLADIQPMDTVSVLKDYRGCDYYLVVTSMKMSGKLQSAKYVTIGGTDYIEKVKVLDMWWKLPYAGIPAILGSYQPKAVYSIDNGEEIEGDIYKDTIDSEYDVWGTDVSLLMSATGKPAGIFFGDASSASKMYGIITESNGPMAWTDGTTVYNVKLIKSDEKEYSYPISEDTYIKDAANPTSIKIKDSTYANLGAAAAALVCSVADPQLATISLKSSGLVDRIEIIQKADVIASSTNIDDDNVMVNLGKWVDATNVVVFNLTNGAGGACTLASDLDETKVVGWTELKKLITPGTDKISSYYINSNNKVEYVVVNAATAMSSGDKYAIYKEQFSDADDWVQFIGHDAYMKGTISVAITKGDVVKYTLSGNEVNITAVGVDYETAVATSTVKKISGNTIELANGTSYKTDSDTVYLDNHDKDDLQVLDKVAVGDAVVVLVDGTDAALAAAIVVVD
jgi:hypothetical protein